MTKAIFENQPELQQAHAKGAHVSIEKAMDGVTRAMSIPALPSISKKKAFRFRKF
jgi:TRAP-type uncharacterized transport system substrate-binding protein